MAGCSYKIEIHQGADRAVKNLDKIAVGMTREEVLNTVGESLLDSLIHDKILVYTYAVKDEGFIENQKIVTVKIYFDDADKVTKVDVIRLGEGADELGGGDGA